MQARLTEVSEHVRRVEQGIATAQATSNQQHRSTTSALQRLMAAVPAAKAAPVTSHADFVREEMAGGAAAPPAMQPPADTDAVQ